MNKLITIVLTLFSLVVFGQKNPTEEAQPIVAEGKLLYRSEMASWYGTDLFLASYQDQNNIGGYFSYTEKEISKCVFFSKSETPKVIGTISFDQTFNIEKAKVDLTERKFSKKETDLFQIRQTVLYEIQLNQDSFYQNYDHTNPNIIPLINGKEKKVYILTGPQQNGVVIFGNDYLYEFSNNNKLVSKKHLHQNIMPIEYGKNVELKEVEGAMHSHSEETGDFITATDICTIMLYEKFAKWKSYTVASKKYLNLWNCETDQLTVVPWPQFNK